MLIAQVNLWAVLAGAASNMILGYLWYGPILGKKWMALLDSTGSPQVGWTPKTIATNKKDDRPMAWAVVVSLITSYILANLIHYFSLGILESLQLALLIWLGFVATTHANNSLFESRKWGLYIIGISYQLVALLVMATIISVWK